MSTGTQASTRRQHCNPPDRAIFQPRRILDSNIDRAGLLALGRAALHCLPWRQLYPRARREHLWGCRAEPPFQAQQA